MYCKCNGIFVFDFLLKMNTKYNRRLFKGSIKIHSLHPWSAVSDQEILKFCLPITPELSATDKIIQSSPVKTEQSTEFESGIVLIKEQQLAHLMPIQDAAWQGWKCVCVCVWDCRYSCCSGISQWWHHLCDSTTASALLVCFLLLVPLFGAQPVQPWGFKLGWQ